MDTGGEAIDRVNEAEQTAGVGPVSSCVGKREEFEVEALNRKEIFSHCKDFLEMRHASIQC